MLGECALHVEEHDLVRRRGEPFELGVVALEQPIRQAGNELGLPVVVIAPRLGRIEQGLLRRVLLDLDEVRQRLADRGDRLEVGRRLGRVTRVTGHDHDDRRSVGRLGQPRRRRGVATQRDQGQLARRGLRDPMEGIEDALSLRGRPRDRSAGDLRSDLVQAEREVRHDPEVAAAATKRPEQVGVLVARRSSD